MPPSPLPVFSSLFSNKFERGKETKNPKNITMKSVGVAVFLVGFVFLTNVGEPAAPPPVPECSNMILSLADCLPFVKNGSTATKPNGTCCDGLKTVLKTEAFCICEAFKNSAQLGFSINLTKALALPSACHLSAPPITNCELAPGSAPAPAIPPIAPSTSSTPAASPPNRVPVPGTGNSSTPAMAPGSSTSFSLALNAGLLLVAMVVSSSSLF